MLEIIHADLAVFVEIKTHYVIFGEHGDLGVGLGYVIIDFLVLCCDHMDVSSHCLSCRIVKENHFLNDWSEHFVDVCVQLEPLFLYQMELVVKV